MPLWVDAYGYKQVKQAWMAIGLLSCPLGVVSGYILTYLIMSELSWQDSFKIQGVIILTLTLLTVFVPKEYTEIDRVQTQMNTLKHERSSFS